VGAGQGHRLAVQEGLELNSLLEGNLGTSGDGVKLRAVSAESHSQKLFSSHPLVSPGIELRL